MNYRNDKHGSLNCLNFCTYLIMIILIIMIIIMIFICIATFNKEMLLKVLYSTEMTLIG